MKTVYVIHRSPSDTLENCSVALTYDERLLRRRKLQTEEGDAFILDLEKATSLEHGDVLECTDGTRVLVQAKPELLAQITGENLPKLAWHIGNRHTPCQIAPNHLLIQHDHVIEHMVTHLGGIIVHVEEPFTPLGGAYGHGRTQSHEHGATTHAHAH